MTNQEILEKAIQKAVEGGWHSEWEYSDNADIYQHFMIDFKPEQYIFNHDFAKALWGDEGFTSTGLRNYRAEGVTRHWQYHLQQMVISPDPIKYLGENIND